MEFLFQTSRLRPSLHYSLSCFKCISPHSLFLQFVPPIHPSQTGVEKAKALLKRKRASTTAWRLHSRHFDNSSGLNSLIMPATLDSRHGNHQVTTKSEHCCEKNRQVSIQHIFFSAKIANFPPVPLLIIVNGGRCQQRRGALFFLLRRFHS